MKKKVGIVIILLLNITLYAFDYEIEIKAARELTWDKKYNEAEKKYIELLDKNKNEEVILDYTNMLAWSGRVEEAILLLKSERATLGIKKSMARFYSWIKKYDEAYRYYTEIKTEESNGYEEGDKFINWYKNYKKWKIGYNYTSDIGNKNINSMPSVSLSYDNYKNYTIIFTREWNYVDGENRTQNNYGELYIDKIYFIAGKSTITNFYYGIDYYFPIITIGVKYADYKTVKVKFYKIEKTIYIKEAELMLNCIIVDNGSEITKNYTAQVKHGIIKIADYFDLKKSNKLILNLKKEDIFGNVDFEGGIGRDFEKNNYSWSFGSWIKF